MELLKWSATIFLISAIPASAEIGRCMTSLNGEYVHLEFDNEDPVIYDNMTFREAFFSNFSCPAYVTLRHLTPELSDEEREAFCLSYDGDAKTYLGFEQGKRDAYGVCKEPSKTFCERVNASKETLLAVTGMAAGASGGTATAAGAAGVTAVTHSSGAVILTGSSGYIAGTLGTASATALGILSAPATIVGAAVGLVAVGGAVYVCKE